MKRLALPGVLCVLSVLAPEAHAVTWSAPATLTPTLEGSRFRAAVNPRGEQAFVWEVTREVSPAPHFRQLTTVGARLRAADGEFGPIQRLRRSTQAISPDVAIAPDGTAIAAWNRSFRGHLRVFAAVRRPGGRFGRAVQVGRTDKAQGAQPQVEFDRRGNAIVLWRWSDRLQWAYRARGHRFGAARTIFVGKRSRRAATEEKFLAFDRRGAAYVAIASSGPQRRRPNGMFQTLVRRGIYLTVRRPGERFGPPRRVSPTGEPGSQPRVAIAADGTAIVIWRAAPTTQTEEQFGPIEATAIVGGRMRTTETLSPPAQRAATEPLVQFTPAGEAIAVWRQFQPVMSPGQPVSQQVAAGIRPAGAEFGPAADVSPPGAGTQGHSLAVTDRGEEIVLWDQRLGDANALVYVTRTAGTAFSAVQQVAPMGLSVVENAGRHIVVVLVTLSGAQVVTGSS